MSRTDYFAPGVYVEEIPSAQQPIAGVGTSTAAFIGVVKDVKYPKRYDPNENKKKIQALEDEINALKAEKAKAPKESLKAAEDSGEEKGKTVTAAAGGTTAPKITPKQNPLDDTIREKQDELNRLKAPELIDNYYTLEPFTKMVEPLVTKLCTNFTEYTKFFGTFSADDPSKEPGNALDQGHRALTHAVYGFFRNGGTRCFVVRVEAEDQVSKALEVIDSIDEVAIVTAPGLKGKPIWGSLVTHCDNAEDRFAILDSHPEVPEAKGKDSDLDLQLLAKDSGSDYLPSFSKNAAFYFPWIEVMDPAVQLQEQAPDRKGKREPKYQGRVYVPPSGHIAGIYARTDVERGVHKAPANCAVAGAINVKYYLSKRHQEGLNPQGVNCIRNINGNIAIWGARTIGGDQNSEWKYINVRRVMLYLRESIDEGTQWVVFEPNDIALWGKIRRNVIAFLTNVWRSGALFGATPEEAFYVKCDAELNPPEVRDLGRVVTEIGVAIVRPAEFVIFRISQSTGASLT